MISDPTLFDGILAPAKTLPKRSDRLLRVFEDIHNHIYATEGLSAEQAFSEVLKLLFMKVLDEKGKEEEQFYIEPGEYELCLERIEQLHKRSRLFFSGVVDKNEEIKLRTGSVAYAVNKLQRISLSDSPGDVKGMAFQKFVYSKQRSHRGQFFTPEPVVKLCVEMMKPKADHRILDPACGTGGFLCEAMRYVFSHSLATASQRDKADYARDNMFGIEINSMIAKIAKMRLLLEGDGYGSIVNADALSEWGSLDQEFAIVRDMSRSCEGYFDMVLTNPPFGIQGKVKDKALLRQFDLGRRWISTDSTWHKTSQLQGGQVPDILFIERCLGFLKVGGQLGIVLPNGDLENVSLRYVRAYLQNFTQVIAVVKLPVQAFIPFGTGIKASVLFLRKTAESDAKRETGCQSRIFLGRVNKIGYQANKNGTPVYKTCDAGEPMTDSNGHFVVDEDVTEVGRRFKEFEAGKLKEETDDCFTLKASEIETRLDVDFYTPSQRELAEYLEGKGARKLGEIVDVVKKRSPKLKSRDAEVDYVELGDINVDYMEISEATRMRVHELPSRATYEIEAGDIITAVAGNSIGTLKHMSAVVTNRFSGCICSNGFRVLKPGPEVDTHYLLLYLRSDWFLRQVSRFRTGAAIPAICEEDLKRILVYLPPKRVQKSIGEKVRNSFEVRERSREILETIEVGPSR